MNIGRRLFELRTAKDFSQGDIERRTGLLRCYVSRVENGHTLPNLETLERWAKALDVKLYQLFFEGNGKAEAVSIASTKFRNTREERLLKFLRQVDKTDSLLILHVAQDLAERTGQDDRA